MWHNFILYSIIINHIIFYEEHVQAHEEQLVLSGCGIILYIILLEQHVPAHVEQLVLM